MCPHTDHMRGIETLRWDRVSARGYYYSMGYGESRDDDLQEQSGSSRIHYFYM